MCLYTIFNICRYLRKKCLTYLTQIQLLCLKLKGRLLRSLQLLEDFQSKLGKQWMEGLHLLGWLRQKFGRKKRWHHTCHVVLYLVLQEVQIWIANQGKCYEAICFINLCLLFFVSPGLVFFFILNTMFIWYNSIFLSNKRYKVVLSLAFILLLLSFWIRIEWFFCLLVQYVRFIKFM